MTSPRHRRKHCWQGGISIRIEKSGSLWQELLHLTSRLCRPLTCRNSYKTKSKKHNRAPFSSCHWMISMQVPVVNGLQESPCRNQIYLCMSTNTLGSRSSFWAPNFARALTAAGRWNGVMLATFPKYLGTENSNTTQWQIGTNSLTWGFWTQGATQGVALLTGTYSLTLQHDTVEDEANVLGRWRCAGPLPA